MRGCAAVSVLFALCLLAGGVPAACAPDGDINGDGLVDVRDALVTLRSAVDLQPVSPMEVERVDFNGNGRVDVSDALVVLQIAVGIRLLVTVRIEPEAAETSTGGSVRFTATVTGSANTAVWWSVQEGPSGGEITSGGMYVAPGRPGTYHVVATSQADPSRSAVAVVTVRGPSGPPPSFVMGGVPHSTEPARALLVAAGASGATGFRLYRSADGVDFRPTDVPLDTTSVPGAAMAYVDLPLDRRSYFFFTALYGASESRPSDVIVCKPGEPMKWMTLLAPRDTAPQASVIIGWEPLAEATGYIAEIHDPQAGNKTLYSVVTPPSWTAVSYGYAEPPLLVGFPGAEPLKAGGRYRVYVAALDRDHWKYASLTDTYFTVQGVPAYASNALTGRWLAVNSRWKPLGAYGLLLVQDAGTVAGTLAHLPMKEGVFDGAVFRGRVSPEEDEVVEFRGTLNPQATALTVSWVMREDGDTASGMMLFTKESSSPTNPDPRPPVVISTEPANGAVGVSRRLDKIRVRWSKPVNGWDFSILGPAGERYGDEVADEARFEYDPATNTFTMALSPDLELMPNTTYQVVLDAGHDVDWHDAYGVPAWSSPSEAYSFTFTTGAQ